LSAVRSFLVRPVCTSMMPSEAVLLNIYLPPSSPLFPYTTLFRSHHRERPPSPGPDQRPARHGEDRSREDRDQAGADRGRVARSSDRKSTRLNSSHVAISYAGFCLKKTTLSMPRKRIATTSNADEH